MSARATGKCKFFYETKGWGFITRDDGKGEVFVHENDLPANVRWLRDGQAVSFKIAARPKGLSAAKVKIVEQARSPDACRLRDAID